MLKRGKERELSVVCSLRLYHMTTTNGECVTTAKIKQFPSLHSVARQRRLTESGESPKDFEGSRRGLKKRQRNKRLLRIAVRFALWWWKAALCCSVGMVTTAAVAFSVWKWEKDSSVYNIVQAGGGFVGVLKGVVPLAFAKFSSFMTLRRSLFIYSFSSFLGFVMAFWKLFKATKQEKEEQRKWKVRFEEKMKQERLRFEEQRAMAREEQEELKKYPGEEFLKITMRMFDGISEALEMLFDVCNRIGAAEIVKELHGSVDSRSFFDSNFERCKIHCEGLVTSYENLLKAITFRKEQERYA